MAIAFDAAAGGAQGSVTSLTFALTVSGSERVILVGAVIDSGDDITGITYAGASLTQIAKVQFPNKSAFCYLYYRIAPSTGANNVVISASGVTTIWGQAASYTGADQSSQPDASATNTTTTTSITGTVTTIANNCWAIMFGQCDNDSLTAQAGTTIRSSSGSNTAISDGNAAVTPPGATTLGYNCASGNNAVVIASIDPSIIGGASLMPLLGIG